MVVHTQPDKFDLAIGRDDGQELMQSRNFTTLMTAPISEPRYRYEFAPQGWVRIEASEAPTEEPGKVQAVSNFY